MLQRSVDFLAGEERIPRSTSVVNSTTAEAEAIGALRITPRIDFDRFGALHMSEDREPLNRKSAFKLCCVQLFKYSYINKRAEAKPYKQATNSG